MVLLCSALNFLFQHCAIHRSAQSFSLRSPLSQNFSFKYYRSEIFFPASLNLYWHTESSICHQFVPLTPDFWFIPAPTECKCQKELPLLGLFEVFPNRSVSYIDLATSLNTSLPGCGAKVSSGLTNTTEDFAIEAKEAVMVHSWLLYALVLTMGDALQLLPMQLC